MKKLFLALFLILFCQATYAINWVDLTTVRGRPLCLDRDSIKKYKNYYFYNIMFVNTDTGETIVATIQSGLMNPFSATVRTYKQDEYYRLKGNYSEITDKVSTHLEPVTYDSVVYTAYQRVKLIKQLEENSLINISE